jgi:hypothetical protein
MPLLDQPDTSIYGKTKLFTTLSGAGQLSSGGQDRGPTAAQQKFQADQQENQQIQQLAAQYGDDYDGLVKAVSQINPERGLKMGSTLEQYRQDSAKTDVENSKRSIGMIDLGRRMLQMSIDDPASYPTVAKMIAAAAPQLAPHLPAPDDPQLSEKLTDLVQKADDTKNYMGYRAEAGQLYFDNKKVEGALTLLAGSKNPDQWQASAPIVKRGGLGDLLSVVKTPEDAQAMLDSRPKDTKEANWQLKETMVKGRRAWVWANPQTLETKPAEGMGTPIPPQSAGGGVGLATPQGGGANPDVKYWADQIQKDPSFATSPLISGAGNAGLRTAIAHELVSRGQSLDKMTAQTRQMGETAKAILPHINTIEQEAKDLEARGLMGPIGSRWREFVGGTLKAGELTTNAADAKLMGQFQANLGLLRSAVARAHGGARGGGSPTMIEHMKTIIQGGGDVPTFLGSTAAVRDWMQTYADEAKQDTKGGKDPLGIR